MKNTSRKILNQLNELGYSHATGVPDSIMKDFIEELELDKRFTVIPANREGECVAIASGAYLANRKCFVYMQNMGIGDIANCIMSLNNLYDIPLLLFISWRGEQGKDSIETIETGLKTEKMLEDLNIRTSKINPWKITEQLKEADAYMTSRKKSAAILIGWGDV